MSKYRSKGARTTCPINSDKMPEFNVSIVKFAPLISLIHGEIHTTSARSPAVALEIPT